MGRGREHKLGVINDYQYSLDSKLYCIVICRIVDFKNLCAKLRLKNGHES